MKILILIVLCFLVCTCSRVLRPVKQSKPVTRVKRVKRVRQQNCLTDSQVEVHCIKQNLEKEKCADGLTEDEAKILCN